MCNKGLGRRTSGVGAIKWNSLSTKGCAEHALKSWYLGSRLVDSLMDLNIKLLQNRGSFSMIKADIGGLWASYATL